MLPILSQLIAKLIELDFNFLLGLVDEVLDISGILAVKGQGHVIDSDWLQLPDIVDDVPPVLSLLRVP